MYYGKKKAIIIGVVIALLIIVLAVAGIFVYIFTDLFKSNQTLFLKYAANQYKQLTSNATDVQLQETLNARKQMPYETNSTLTFNYQDENGENIEELEKVKMNIITREDKLNEKQYSNLKIDYDNNNLINIHYTKSNNIYALKWEEIVLKYFVGIENKDLREFAEKLGVEGVENLPNEITTVDYMEILELTEQEKQHLIQTYMGVIIENIPSEKYTKQKDMAITKNGVNYNATAYRLDLSAEEIKNIELKILETLKQDSITLNLITTKAKLLKLSEEYTTINSLTSEIQKTINEISAEQVDNSKGLSIVVYENKGQTIQTELIFKNVIKITTSSDIKNNAQSINLLIDNLSEEQEYNTANINIVKTQRGNNTVVNFNIDIDNEQTVTINTSNIGVASTGNVEVTVSVSLINATGENLTVNYDAQTIYGSLTEDIVDLDNTNCVILNDYSSQDLRNLITSIVQRVSYVFGQKMQTLGQ